VENCVQWGQNDKGKVNKIKKEKGRREERRS